MTTTTDDLSEIEALARAATPGDLDTADHIATGWYKCPCCDGEGEVLGETFTNFDEVAMGVQFFGVGDEFEAYERYFRHMSPARTLRLTARLTAAEARATTLEADLARAEDLIRGVGVRMAKGQEHPRTGELMVLFADDLARALAAKLEARALTKDPTQ